MFLAISRNFLELLEHLQFDVYASACVMHLFHKDCSIVYSYTQLFSTGHCLQLTAVGLQLKKVSVLNAMMFQKNISSTIHYAIFETTASRRCALR